MSIASSGKSVFVRLEYAPNRSFTNTTVGFRGPPVPALQIADATTAPRRPGRDVAVGPTRTFAPFIISAVRPAEPDLATGKIHSRPGSLVCRLKKA